MIKEDLLKQWKEFKVPENILSAFKKIKRENFVLGEYKNQAYDDIALPIGYGVTISQPSTIILMLEKLDIKKGNKILEIGAGSGYNAALISQIVGPKGKIFSFEIIPEIAEFAKKNLKKAKVKNVKIMEADGSKGYKEKAPFDRIIITAACEEGIPQILIDQLRINGKLIAPVGKGVQEMILITKLSKTKIKKEFLGSFVFVPLQRK